jgi:tetratricopeptide (TPR) repeat protein
MRSKRWLLLLTGFISATALAGTDKPIMAPPADWVKPVAMPAKPDKAEEAPIRILLIDQQSRLEPGQVANYANVAIYIQTPQGLSAGNLSLPWNPQTDNLTVHKLIIHRDGKDIDVLAEGQTFTVVRREPNLESATLDGMLTANIQPEGLQVGDVLEYAVTVTRSDPVLKGHVEQIGAAWNGLPFTRTHMSVSWPTSMAVAFRQNGALPPVKPVRSGNMTKIELSLDNVEPVIPPAGAPARFGLGRMIEFSDFKSWADLGALMAPLYAQAAVIPAQGPLRNEVDKIKAASADPMKRAEAALALVQDRVRYVALLMGVGGLTPAKAEETWARRYGDCKAKSVLLLALLGELGIDAEPVAANILSSDGLDQRLPMVGLFNHVLVRARIGGNSYWLDGTRSGDASLARLQVPYFNWGLPLVAQGAALVRMMPKPLEEPESDLAIEIDARQGLTLPAPFKAEMVMRGDGAMASNLALAGMPADQRDKALRDYWREQFNFVDATKVDAKFDRGTGEERLTVEGTAQMEWKDGWYQTDKTGVGFNADFVRATGPDQTAPFENSYPGYSRTVETIQLPPGFSETGNIEDAAVDETIAGTEYRRQAKLVGGVYRIERTVRDIAPEFPASEAPAAQKRLRALADKTVYIRRPTGLRLTSKEIDQQFAKAPATVGEMIARGNLMLEQNRPADALVDFSDALEKEPKNLMALSDRGLAYVYLNQSDKAAADLDAAQAIDPNYYVMWHGRGLIAERKGDYAKAAEAYGKAIDTKADDRWALGRRAYMRRVTGDLDGALSDSARALSENPAWVDMHRLRADVFRIKGDVKSAVAEADSMAGPEQGSLPALMQAGGIYVTLAMHDKAVATYDRVIAISPSIEAYLSRARARDKADRSGRLADLDAGQKLSPDDPRIVILKAEMLIEASDYAGAVKIYDAALAKQQNQPLFLLRRAIAYARAGDNAHASKDFAAVRGTNKDPAWLNNLCWEKGTAGVALESALADCDAALSAAPGTAAFLDSRALVLLRLGRLDDAIATYDTVLAKSRVTPSSLYGRAIALSRKGTKEKAQVDRDAALKLDPDVQKQFEGYGVTM